MKEEYLEIEEFDFNLQSAYNDEDETTGQEGEGTYAQHTDEGQQRLTLPSNSAEQQNSDVFQTQPADFDGDNDDQMLRKLLKKFQMSFLYPFLKAYDVTYRSLRFLSVDDINATIRSVGHRAEFREKLFAWRRKRYRTHDIIIEYEKIPQTVTASAAADVYRSTTPPSCSKSIKRSPSFANDPTEIQSDHTKKSTSFQSIMHSIKRDSSTMQNPNGDEMLKENETIELEAKKMKFEIVLGLQENRLNTHVNLDDILGDSLFGPVMKAYYKKYGTLERKHRDEMIQIIVNYVTANEIKLHSSDFTKIVEMIINIFPSEEEFRDYYYIHRQGKRSPMGRLYTKYYNTLKRLRVRDIHQELTQELAMPSLHSNSTSNPDGTTNVATATTSSSALRHNPFSSKNANEANNGCSNSQAIVGGSGSGTSNNTQIELIEDDFEELIQVDTSVSAMKNFLSCQGLEWSEIRTMWSKTYLSRLDDIEHLTTKNVLKQWIKYLSGRGMELFDIDFRMKFSRYKLNSIQRKWPLFARKMAAYYQTNVKDEVCKGLFALFKTKPGKDTEDYLITVLLNSIMIPMGRYRDILGNRRKVSIVDAVDLFAIRVTNLEELDQKREEIAIKYGDMHSEYTPLIVVVGDNNININEIYVHFDIALYEMPDFLTALDACMKIYKVLNLPYATSNEYLWTFIQRYFYELQLPDDLKCPSMSTIISYLKF